MPFEAEQHAILLQQIKIAKTQNYRFSVNPSLKPSGILSVAIVPTTLLRSNLFQVSYPGLIPVLVFFITFLNHALKLHPELSFLFNPTADKLG